MDEPLVFQPDRLLGTATHLFTILVLLIAGAWGIWQAAQAVIGPALTLYLLVTIITLGLVPFLAYRLLGLRRAVYLLERDGISLRWGLRVEEIPMDDVYWIQHSEQLERPLPAPFFRLPGIVLGARQMSGGGTVEYFATRSRNLVVIATKPRTFALSPEEPEDFIITVQRLMELGSLAPIPARSLYPTFLLARVWRTPAARYLILAGMVLNIILFAWISIQAPAHSQITLGFATVGEPVPSVRLLLLPVISGLFFSVDLFLGLYFFRREDGQSMFAPASITETPSSEVSGTPPDPLTETIDSAGAETPLSQAPPRRPGVRVPDQVLAYLLWGSGVLTAALFMIATIYILAAAG